MAGFCWKSVFILKLTLHQTIRPILGTQTLSVLGLFAIKTEPSLRMFEESLKNQLAMFIRLSEPAYSYLAEKTSTFTESPQHQTEN